MEGGQRQVEDNSVNHKTNDNILSGPGMPLQYMSEFTKNNNYSPQKPGGKETIVADKTIAPVYSQLNVDPSHASIGFGNIANTPDGKIIAIEEKKHSRP